MSDLVSYHLDDGVATLTLNNARSMPFPRT